MRSLGTQIGLPLLFVFLWSTGFIVSKIGLPYAPPIGFLTLRFAIAALLLLLFLPIMSVSWPTDWRLIAHSAVAGILLQAIYLGGVFTAISLGIGAGLAALLVGLQPLLTVIMAALFLNERLSRRKVSGVLIGLIGACLVLVERGMETGTLSTAGLVLCFCALFGISVGTVYQKRFCTQQELLPGVAIQYVASVFFLLPLALLFEDSDIVWDIQFVFALGWLVVVLSLGAVFLLMWMIRNGEAGKVASLFYLVPPVVAVEAWLLFDETITPLVVVGIALCIGGVALVIREAPTTSKGTSN